MTLPAFVLDELRTRWVPVIRADPRDAGVVVDWLTERVTAWEALPDVLRLYAEPPPVEIDLTDPPSFWKPTTLMPEWRGGVVRQTPETAVEDDSLRPLLIEVGRRAASEVYAADEAKKDRSGYVWQPATKPLDLGEGGVIRDERGRYWDRRGKDLLARADRAASATVTRDRFRDGWWHIHYGKVWWDAFGGGYEPAARRALKRAVLACWDGAVKVSVAMLSGESGVGEAVMDPSALIPPEPTSETLGQTLRRMGRAHNADLWPPRR